MDERPGQDLVTGADGTVVADIADDVVRFQISPDKLLGESGPIFGSVFVFDVAADGTVTESFDHFNERLVGPKRIEGIEKVTPITIVFPRISKVDDKDPRLPSFWNFPHRLDHPPGLHGRNIFPDPVPYQCACRTLDFLISKFCISLACACVAHLRCGEPNKVNRFLLFYHHTLSLQSGRFSKRILPVWGGLPGAVGL